MTNVLFATKDENFLKACEEAGLPPTPRQASKYKRKMGLVYKLKLGLVSPEEVKDHQKGFRSN